MKPRVRKAKHIQGWCCRYELHTDARRPASKSPVYPTHVHAWLNVGFELKLRRDSRPAAADRQLTVNALSLEALRR